MAEGVAAGVLSVMAGDYNYLLHSTNQEAETGDPGAGLHCDLQGLPPATCFHQLASPPKKL